MALPVKYNIANVFVRWRSTVSTIVGIAMVVAVAILVQALAVGLKKSGADTGVEGNLLVMRKGAPAESSTRVPAAEVKPLKFLPGVPQDPEAKPLISPD